MKLFALKNRNNGNYLKHSIVVALDERFHVTLADSVFKDGEDILFFTGRVRAERFLVDALKNGPKALFLDGEYVVWVNYKERWAPSFFEAFDIIEVDLP